MSCRNGSSPATNRGRISSISTMTDIMACGHSAKFLRGTTTHYCQACYDRMQDKHHEMQCLAILWEASLSMSPKAFRLLKAKVLSVWEGE